MDLRDQILNADDLKRTEVAVPESWGGKLWVREMSGKDRDEFENLLADNTAKGLSPTNGVRPLILVQTICNEDGTPVFTMEDREALEQKNIWILHELFEKSAELNKLAPDAEATEEAK